MKFTTLIPYCVLLLMPVIVAEPALAQGNGPADGPRFFYGGSIGLAFGEVDYYEVAPLLGVRLTPRLATGLSLLYRRRDDSRFDPDLSTEDYGATIFGRIHILRGFYLQAEYEYLDYEYVVTGTTTERRDFTSILAGGGVSRPLGPNSRIYATALYNFSYDEPDSPYSDPWNLRVGVGFGF